MDQLYIVMIGACVVLFVIATVLAFNTLKSKRTLKAFQEALSAAEDSLSQSQLSQELEKKRMTAEIEFMKEEGLELNSQLESVQSTLENLTKQLRNIEGRNLELESIVSQDRGSQSTRQVSYQITDAEIARRIQDAIEPWRIKVFQLESELDLLKIESESPFGRSPNPDIIQANTNEFKRALEQAQSENMTLQLKLNRAVGAYDELKSKLQQAEVFVARLNKAHETEIRQLKTTISQITNGTAPSSQ